MQNPSVRFNRAALATCSDGGMGSRHRDAVVVPRREGIWELTFHAMSPCHFAVGILRGGVPLGQNKQPTCLHTLGFSNFRLLKANPEPQDHQKRTI